MFSDTCLTCHPHFYYYLLRFYEVNTMKLAVQVHPDTSVIATCSHMFPSVHNILLELKYNPGFLFPFTWKSKCLCWFRKPLCLRCWLLKELISVLMNCYNGWSGQRHLTIVHRVRYQVTCDWQFVRDSLLQNQLHNSDGIRIPYILVQATLFVFILPIHWLSQVLLSYFYACAKAILYLVHFIYWKTE